MLPVNERRKPYHGKEKLPTQATSKNSWKCAKCKAIVHMSPNYQCPNCLYKHMFDKDMPGIKKASDLENGG